MNKALTFLLTLLSLSVFGQSNPTKEAQPIVTEGKLLYKSEMASWYGTDLFLEKTKDKKILAVTFRILTTNFQSAFSFLKLTNLK